MNSQARILIILEALLKGEACTKDLAVKIFGKSTPNTQKNIQNDLKIIKRHFNERYIVTRRGCQKLIDIPQSFHNLYEKSADEMVDIFQFVALFDSERLKLFKESEPKLVAKIRKETDAIFHVFDTPFEELKDEALWKQLKKVIRDRRYISIAYEKNRLQVYNNIKPIRIVYAKNNWYLAALLTENIETFDFTFFRISNIKHITIEANNFHRDMQVIEHLRGMQSLYERYDVPSYEVRVLISKDIAKYFKKKKYLKSQTILKEKADGSLSVSFSVNCDMEIIPLIKQWAPDIVVESPHELKKKMEDIFKKYLQD